MNDLIAIARLGAAFGIKGYVKVYPLSHDPNRFSRLKEMFIGRTPADVSPVTIEDVKVHQNAFIVKLNTVPDRTAAERMTGNICFVPVSEVVTPPRGTWFVDDVVGCMMQRQDGTPVGIVREVQKYPAQDLWIIDHHGKPVMIPAVKEFIKRVDISKRIIVVENVEGFLEG